MAVKAPAATDEKLYRVALREALNEEMERDDSVYAIGEDIGKFGGAHRVTEGLLDRFGPQRVVDAPIAEEVIVGCAIGSAMLGLRPVVELMTINFSLLALDQIVNHASHIRYMFGGQVSVPLVVRMPQGAGHQLGPTHSHSWEALYLHVPGLLVAVPVAKQHDPDRRIEIGEVVARLEIDRKNDIPPRARKAAGEQGGHALGAAAGHRVGVDEQLAPGLALEDGSVAHFGFTAEAASIAAPACGFGCRAIARRSGAPLSACSTTSSISAA